jgi:hypothetical protein
MLRDSSDGIEEFTTSVTGFINECIDDVIPTVTVRTYPKQKPWITGNIRTELRLELPGSRSGTLIRTIIKEITLCPPMNYQAKCQYRTKIKFYYTGADTHQMWQGL